MEQIRFTFGMELEPIPTTMEFQFTDLNKIVSVELVNYITDNPEDQRAVVKLLQIKDPIRCKKDGFVSSMAPFSNMKLYEEGDNVKTDLSKFRIKRTQANLMKNEDWRIQLIMMMEDDFTS